MIVESSELEILRMSAEIRAGHTSVVATFFVSAASLLLLGSALLWMILSGVVFGEGAGALIATGIATLLISNIFICFGWNRVNRSLRRVRSDVEIPSAATVQNSVSDGNQEFAGALSPGSVTERTTNLLGVPIVAAKTDEFRTDEISSVKK